VAERTAQPHVIVRVATLDADPGTKPVMHTWCSHDVPWLQGDKDIPFNQDVERGRSAFRIGDRHLWVALSLSSDGLRPANKWPAGAFARNAWGAPSGLLAAPAASRPSCRSRKDCLAGRVAASYGSPDPRAQAASTPMSARGPTTRSERHDSI